MKVITTRYEDNQKSTVCEEVALNQDHGAAMQVINLYPEFEFQTFHGFGGAITEASGYAYSKLSKENQEKVLELYFGKTGNRYNIARGHIDSCDFSLGNYSAITDPEDVEMKTFTLERDEQYIIPLMKAAEQKRGEAIELLLSPWSPPAFMKTNGEKNCGGKLKPEFRGFWAEYICRYIKEYQKRGFFVSWITIQNEPNAVQKWDSCLYTAEDEKVFIRDFLYPAMIKNELTDVKITIWDHNKERMYERAKVTIDQDTISMIDGVAYHWYTGDHFEAIKITAESFPGKELIFTEGCVEYSRFGTNQLQNAQMYAHDIMGNLNAGMTASIDWNILLDEKGGPNHVENYCDAPIMINTKEDTFEVKLSFDYIGHFSRYIHKGAKRIGLTKYTNELEMTAFKNTDGSIVLVVLNRNEQDYNTVIRMEGKSVGLAVPKSSIVTAVIES
ncbi:MAG: glycoside hydrolase family 30 [Herbinix sp.]|nr:glycoside hydrolase family 30 [Herbinix sp.]